MKRKFQLTYTQIIVFGFATLILLGALILMLPISSRDGVCTPFINSLFTSTSATCVTGLIAYDTYTHWSLFGQLVILTLIQIGGVGFMSLITVGSMFMKRKIGLRERILLTQSAGTLQVGGITKLIKRIVFGTLAFETVGASLLSIRFCADMGIPKGIYYAIFHSVSAFCNGGFDLMGRFGKFSSLTNYSDDILVNTVIMILIIVGGLGFLVWSDIIETRFRFSKLKLHSRIVLITSATLLLGGAAILFVLERNASLAQSGNFKVLHVLFQSVSARTAGFNTTDLSALSDGGSIFTMLLMLIGGSPGSTAGGLETTTFAIMILNAVASARKNNEIVVSKRSITADIVRQASAIAAIYIGAVFVSTIVLSAIEPFALKEIMFEVCSAIGTVGTTMGITQSLCALSKVIIILLMVAGRVGGLTLMLVIAEKRESVPVSRPSEKLLIG